MPEAEQKYKKYILIKGAREHNLKNIDVSIPRDKLIVITGLSGSGKSSLAFDTLYAEGQRRYVESLSAYARQFLGKIGKPNVDLIQGIPPAIAIEQKSNTRNPRSTVGTSTEIYDYLKLLYARVGVTVNPETNREVKRNSVEDVISYMKEQSLDSTHYIQAPASIPENKTLKEYFQILQQQGYRRIEYNNEFIKTDSEVLPKTVKDTTLYIVIDAISYEDDKDVISQIADSVELAFFEGKGKCRIKSVDNSTENDRLFTNIFEDAGTVFEEPTTHMFSFNNPLGACPICEGYGQTIGIDEDLVIPDKSQSVYEGAVACWKGEKMGQWLDKLIYSADKFGFPIHKPFYQLSDDHKQLLWHGNKYFHGLHDFFAMLEQESYKIQYRVMLARYRGKTVCPECNGSRLKKQAGYVKIGGKSINELVLLPVYELHNFFNTISFSDLQTQVAARLLTEIRNRLQFLMDVGLGYLTLNRKSATLSGGESQRINLATTLGSSLVGSLYILDEPSIGLHPRDTSRLIAVLHRLRDIGNTVVVVEHDEEIIRSSDEIIDLGPFAGRLGGNVVFQGTVDDLYKATESDSFTSKYINGIKSIPLPSRRKTWNNYIEILGATENNLKNIDVRFPLNGITVVTGVSGSGKSSLVKHILYPALKRKLGEFVSKPGKHAKLGGDLHLISTVEFVDQNPIGKSTRSNPVTYLKAYDEIRNLYASQQYAKANNFKTSHFSFNIDGGRCEECQGEGIIKVEMQFMADVHLTCESCNGMRFKDDVLEVRYKEKNIYDILEMTINEAIEFFGQESKTSEKKIVNKLQPLADVGLGYVKMGQSSSTLSGGESQRVKLAFFLSKEKAAPSLFLFDEPTTGLHFEDINKLLESFNALVRRGHSIIIIEHNPEVIKCADWVIDLGPDGGNTGGYIIATGTPEEIANNPESITGKYIKHKL